jgi:hypothetical protein
VLVELSAQSDVAETSSAVCTIDEGTLVTISEERISPTTGDARVRLVDPMWNVWLTRRAAASGHVYLEPIAPTPSVEAAGTLGGIRLPPPQQKHQPVDVTDGGGGGGGGGGAAADGGAEGGADGGAGGAARPLNEREQRERDSGRWKAGTMVLLTGLRKMREYNGRSGVLVSWISESAKYEVRLANRSVRVRAACVDLHPMQRKKEQETKGDEVVFMSTDEQAARSSAIDLLHPLPSSHPVVSTLIRSPIRPPMAHTVPGLSTLHCICALFSLTIAALCVVQARAGTYGVKLDPQFWFDQALDRVFQAANEYEVPALAPPPPLPLPRRAPSPSVTT